MITFKDSVVCERIEPVIFAAIVMAHEVYNDHGINGLVVTSLRDGEHMPGSKHAMGRAFDCRIWTVPEENRASVYETLQEKLGDEFDVVWHKNSHFHIEYDPE